MLHETRPPRSRASTAACSLLLTALASLAALASLTACGGGGGGGASGRADAIALSFPPPHGLTDQIGFPLFGTTARPRRIARIEANGIPGATSDGFNHWKVDFALSAPTTDFAIDALDGASDLLSEATASIEFAPVPTGAIDLGYDPARDQILTCETQNLSGLTGLDLASGRPIFVSGPARGDGPDFDGEVRAVAVDAANDRAFVLTTFQDEVVSVRLRDGGRFIVSDFFSSGVDFQSPDDIALDASRARLVVTDDGLDAIVAVDVATGARSILSDATHGSGTALGNPQRLVVVEGVDVALVITRDADDLLSVNLANGNRSVVSGASRGTGPAIVNPRTVTFDAIHGQAIVVNSDLSLLSVDLATGDRVQFASDTEGTGPTLSGLQDIVVLPTKFIAAAVVGLKTVLEVNPDTSDRRDLETLRVGAGDRVSNLAAIAADPAADEYFFVQNDLKARSLYSLDPRTGDRTLISSPTRGTGPAIGFVRFFDVVTRRRRAFLADFLSKALLAVDLDTGDRTVVSDATTGAGIVLEDPICIAVDDERNVAFVEDFNSLGETLVSVDLATGNRTEVSGPHRGSGPDPLSVESLALERSGESVLLFVNVIVDVFPEDAVMRIDLATGDRSIVSGGSIGAGPDFFNVFPNLVLTRDARHAFVPDNPGILEVDLATGDRTLIAPSDPSLGPGISFISPFSAFGEERIFALHRNIGAVVEVDLASGNRVVISR